jgi:DNA-binding CsgD family transcriptional regulator
MPDRVREARKLERLRRRDLETLQASISELYVLGDLRAFRSRIVRLLSAVVPGDLAVYAEIDVRSRRVSWDPEVEPALGLADAQSVFTRHMGDLPIFKRYRRGEGSAAKISDFMTQRQFRRTAIYNEFFRRVGLEYQIAKGLPGPPGLVTSVSVLRRGRDFSERHRLLLDLLRPHLNQAYRNAQAVDAMQAELATLRNGVDALDRGLVILDTEDRVVLMTTRARQWMQDYFERLPAAGLPPSLVSWLRRARPPMGRPDDAPPPLPPLTLDRDARQLVIRLVATGEQSVLMLTERRTEPTPEALRSLGLSRRETEALAWVAEGKTNADIAIILGASVRTIDKHLERVFRKLGVETRTAAAACALALLRS